MKEISFDKSSILFQIIQKKMKQTLNTITGARKLVPDFAPLDNDEIILNNYFTNELLRTNNYTTSRRNTIIHILENADVKQETLDKLANVRDLHFKASSSDIPGVNELITQEELDINVIAKPSLDLLNYLAPIVKGMSNSTFDILVTISDQLPHLVYFTLQPAFLLALGIKSFLVLIPVLFHKGNFVKLLHYCNITPFQQLIEQNLTQQSEETRIVAPRAPDYRTEGDINESSDTISDDMRTTIKALSVIFNNFSEGVESQLLNTQTSVESSMAAGSNGSPQLDASSESITPAPSTSELAGSVQQSISQGDGKSISSDKTD